MADKIVDLPPDKPLLDLAKAANAQLQPAGGISFFRRRIGETEDIGIVFECGTRRAVVFTRNALSVADVDQIVASVRKWMSRTHPLLKWTTDPSEAA